MTRRILRRLGDLAFRVSLLLAVLAGFGLYTTAVMGW